MIRRKEGTIQSRSDDSDSEERRGIYLRIMRGEFLVRS